MSFRSHDRLGEDCKDLRPLGPRAKHFLMSKGISTTQNSQSLAYQKLVDLSNILTGTNQYKIVQPQLSEKDDSFEPQTPSFEDESDSPTF